MKYHLVSGACGFVGRNLVKRLLTTTQDVLVIVDDLSVGTHPSTWLPNPIIESQIGQMEVYHNGRIQFWKGDFKLFLQNIQSDSTWLAKNYNLHFEKFNDVFRCVGTDACVGVVW